MAKYKFNEELSEELKKDICPITIAQMLFQEDGK